MKNLLNMIMLVGIVTTTGVNAATESSIPLTLSESVADHHHHEHVIQLKHSKKATTSFVLVKPNDKVKIFEKTKKGYKVVKGGKMTKSDKKAIKSAEEDVRKERPHIRKVNRAYQRKLDA
jgi:hypothetical protein